MNPCSPRSELTGTCTLLAGDAERILAPVQLRRPVDWVLHFRNATLQKSASKSKQKGLHLQCYYSSKHTSSAYYLPYEPFFNADRLTWVQELLGVAYERMLQELPHLSVQKNLTSVVGHAA